MRQLLDANAFLFFIAGDPRLSTAARLAIDDPHSEKLISIATLWEIAIKASIGKLALAKPFEVLIPTQIASRATGYSSHTHSSISVCVSCAAW